MAEPPPPPPEERPAADEPDSAVDPQAETLPADHAPASAGPARRKDSVRLQRREFGDYEILSEVARGAMGIVYRARHKRLDREVALKVLLSGEHASEAEVRRFTREAQALARLRHPHIVPIHDIGEVDGRHYFTMDFVEGQTLGKLLAERQLTVTEALEIIEQTADAVAAAHGRGVIHRDLKPSNIILDAEGRCHIMDFGLAKAPGGETKHTRDGTTIGTPGYMPPEQAKGELSQVDERSDVYSMGAVLYEMLAGRAAFGGTNLLETVLAVINEDPPRLRSVNPRAPRELEIIVHKCLEKNPARRYRSAAALRDDVRRYRAGEPILARPASLGYLAAKKLRKHWFSLATAGSALAFGALALALVLHYRARDLEHARGSEPEWREAESFPAANPLGGWSAISFAGEEILDEDTGYGRPRPPAPWGARVSAENQTVYGNARVQLDFEVAGDLAARSAGLGFLGDNQALCFFRLRAGRLELLAQADPDRAGSSAAVVADRRLPPLAPGRRCRARVERLGLEVGCVLEVQDGREFRELAHLRYAHPGLSNFRYRHLRVLVRGAEKTAEQLPVLKLLALRVEKQLLPKRPPTSLVGADDRFYRGDYDGAIEEYNAVLADPRARPAERAAARQRRGLYCEIKRDLDRHLELARADYAEARRLAESVAEKDRDKALEQCAADALARELVVTGRLLRAGAAPPAAFGALLRQAARDPELLRGRWSWELAGLVGELSGGGSAGAAQALDLGRQLEPPPGSLVFARNYAALGAALVEARRGRELPALAARCPERPLAAPLAESVRRAVSAVSADEIDWDWVLAALRRGAELFKPGNPPLVEAARQACQPAIAARNSRLVIDIVSAAGKQGLVDCCREAAAAAVDAARTGAAREEARQLLSFSQVYGADDRVLANAAVLLGRKYCEAGDFGGVLLVREAYPTDGLAEVYAQAAAGLCSAGALAESLAMIEEARDKFPRRRVPELAEAAVRVGRACAPCRAEGDEARVIRAYEAGPDPAHLDNFLTALESLRAEAAGGTRKRLAAAGELFAFARARLGAGAALNERAAAVIEGAVAAIRRARRAEELEAARKDLEAFLRPLDAVEVSLALSADAAALADWRLELAGYHLLAGDVQRAGAAYEQARDEARRAPAAAARAQLRHGLLLALEGSRAAARGKLDEARKLADDARGGEATLFAAQKVLEKDLDEAAFRREAAEGRLLSPAEVEVVLAARAALDGRAEERRRRLAEALKAVPGAAWPYELIRYETDRGAGA